MLRQFNLGHSQCAVCPSTEDVQAATVNLLNTVIRVHPVVLQVGKTGTDCKADLEMLSLHDLRAAMPGLWKRPASSTHPHLVYAHPPLTEATAAAKAQGVPDIPIEVLEEYRRRAIKVAAGE